MVKCVTARQEQLRIVKLCHIDPTSGHLGIKKTYYRVIEQFTWNAVMKDVQETVSCYYYMVFVVPVCHHAWCHVHTYSFVIQVSTCDKCQHVKDKIVTAKLELHPISIHSIWHHIGIDFVGPITPPCQDQETSIFWLFLTISLNGYVPSLCRLKKLMEFLLFC